MRSFEDADGRVWVASVRERPGPDYKGRYHFFMAPEEGDDAEGAQEAPGGGGVALLDVRWNTERTARRTLETMSEVELRRRLRQALGRESGPGSTGGATRPAAGGSGDPEGPAAGAAAGPDASEE